MPAEQVRATAPFGAVMGDTYPFPVVELLDANGAVVDPSGFASVDLDRYDEMGAVTQMTGVISGQTIEFRWSASDTDLATTWATNVVVDEDGTLKYTLPAPILSVYDTQAMWSSVAEVELIVGQGVYSQWSILEAIQIAESAVRTRVTLEDGSPVPTRVRQATTTMAARVLTSGSGVSTGSAIIEERIADYSVRYAEASSGGALTFDDGIRDLLLPWWPRSYQTDVGERRASLTSDDDEFYPGVV